jgi:hypothetical protein
VTLQPTFEQGLVVGASGITINAAAGPIINNLGALGLSADQTWTNNSTNPFVVPSFIYGDANRRGPRAALAIDGPGDTALTGGIYPLTQLIKNGVGTLTLGGDDDNIGLAVTANAGTLILDKASVATPGLFVEVHAIGSALTIGSALVQLAGTGDDQIYQSATVDVQSGGTFDMNGRFESFRHLKLAGRGVDGQGALVNNAAGTSATLQFIFGAINSMTLTGDTTVGGAGDLIVFGVSSVSAGNYDLNKVGAGSVILPSGNYNDVMVSAGTLSIGGAAFAASSGFVNVDADARFRTGGLNTARTFNVDGTLEIAAGQSLQLTGGQLINNGTVIGPVSIGNGAIAKGTGVFDVVTVNEGGTFAPGNSPGIATANSLQFASATGGTLAIELAGTLPGAEYDQLRVLGALHLGGQLSVSRADGFAPAPGDSFDILDFGTLTGTFSNISLPELPSRLTWDTTRLYTNGEISVAAVPEPSCIALCIIAIIFAAQFRRLNPA